jgi:hypothetical protein
MSPVFAAVTTQTLSGLLVLLYLAAGVATAMRLEQRHRPRGAVVGALLAWPLMLPLLGDTAPIAARGPMADRIDASLRSLAHTLADPAAQDVGAVADLSGLRTALHAADARLALVDRVLADAPEGPATGEVRAARARGERAIVGVLDEVQQLRLQVGMAAIAGGSDLLAERLAELSARAGALAEVRSGGVA